MKTIEYLNQKIEVPEKWEDVTLKTFDSFFKNRPSSAREKLSVIAKICNVSPEILLNWPAEILPIIFNTVNFLWLEYIVAPKASVSINGVSYVIQIEEKLSLGEYIDADEAQKAENDVLSNVLAIVCRPAGEEYDPDKTEERAEMFGNLSMAEIQPLLTFFLTCKNESEKRTKAFLNLMELVESLPQNTHVLRNLGGGINLFQIWQIIKYGILIALLRHRLRRLSRLLNTSVIKIKPTKRKEF